MGWPDERRTPPSLFRPGWWIVLIGRFVAHSGIRCVRGGGSGFRGGVDSEGDGMAQASRYETWPVRGRLRGKNGKKSKDVSGIDCATAQGFPRAGLVIDDNMQEAQFVSVKDGEIVAGDMITLIDDSFDGKHLELDGESVAYAGGYFYVIGSHGHPRDHKRRLPPDKEAARIAAQIAASKQNVP